MQDSQPSAAERLMQAGLEREHARFDADLGLIEERTDTGVFHPIREAFGYAYTLMRAEGDVAAREDAVRAEKGSGPSIS